MNYPKGNMKGTKFEFLCEYILNRAKTRRWKIKGDNVVKEAIRAFDRIQYEMEYNTSFKSDKKV